MPSLAPARLSNKATCLGTWEPEDLGSIFKCDHLFEILDRAVLDSVFTAVKLQF